MIRILKVLNTAIILLVAITHSSLAQDVLYSRSQGYTVNSMEKKYKIRRGDTLYRIIKNRLKLVSNVKSVAEKIVKNNPKSFPTGNKDFMLSGTNLRLTMNKKYENRMRNRDEIFFVK